MEFPQSKPIDYGQVAGNYFTAQDRARKNKRAGIMFQNALTDRERNIEQSGQDRAYNLRIRALTENKELQKQALDSLLKSIDPDADDTTFQNQVDNAVTSIGTSLKNMGFDDASIAQTVKGFFVNGAFNRQTIKNLQEKMGYRKPEKQPEFGTPEAKDIYASTGKKPTPQEIAEYKKSLQPEKPVKPAKPTTLTEAQAFDLVMKDPEAQSDPTEARRRVDILMGKIQPTANDLAEIEKESFFGRKIRQLGELFGIVEEQPMTQPGLTQGSQQVLPPDQMAVSHGQGAAAPQGAEPVPQTPEDYNALPSGTIYRDPDDGKLYRKP